MQLFLFHFALFYFIARVAAPLGGSHKGKRSATNLQKKFYFIADVRTRYDKTKYDAVRYRTVVRCFTVVVDCYCARKQMQYGMSIVAKFFLFFLCERDNS